MERRYKILLISRHRETKRWSRTMRVLSFREQWLTYCSQTDDKATAYNRFTSFLNCYDMLQADL